MGAHPDLSSFEDFAQTFGGAVITFNQIIFFCHYKGCQKNEQS